MGEYVSKYSKNINVISCIKLSLPFAHIPSVKTIFSLLLFISIGYFFKNKKNTTLLFELRLINPGKSDFGNIFKKILDRVNAARSATVAKQWTSTI